MNPGADARRLATHPSVRFARMLLLHKAKTSLRDSTLRATPIGHGTDHGQEPKKTTFASKCRGGFSRTARSLGRSANCAAPYSSRLASGPATDDRTRNDSPKTRFAMRRQLDPCSRVAKPQSMTAMNTDPLTNPPPDAVPPGRKGEDRCGREVYTREAASPAANTASTETLKPGNRTEVAMAPRPNSPCVR